MSEALYIEMPARKKGSPRPLWSLASFLCGRFYCCSRRRRALVAGPGARVASERAMLDAMVHVVAPEFSAPVEAFYVKEGDRVRRGQPLLRMNARAYQGRLGEAGREAAALRGMAGPPTMEETAARLKAAQDAEQDMVRRLAQARNEEDVKQQLRQERVPHTYGCNCICAPLTVRAVNAPSARADMPRPVRPRRRRAGIWNRPRWSLKKPAVCAPPWSRSLAASGRRCCASSRWRRSSGTRPCLHAQATPPVVVDANLYAPVDSRVLRVWALPVSRRSVAKPWFCFCPKGLR